MTTPDPIGLQPPQDLEAEAAVLGAMLKGGDTAIATARKRLVATDFYRTGHGLIFRAVGRLADDRQPVDMVAVGSELRRAGRLETVGGMEYLDRLVRGTPYSANVERYADAVLEQAIKRSVHEAGLAIHALACDPMLSAQATLERAEAALHQAIARAPGDDTMRAGVDLDRVAAEQARQAMSDPIRTGLPTLDHLINGGIHRRQVHILAARTGKGKSAMVCQFILNAMCQGRKVGLLSLEMETWEVMARLTALETGLPYWQFEHGADGLPPGGQERRDAGGTRHALAERDLLVLDDARGYGVDAMRRKLRRMREEYGCELLVVDLVNRIRSPGSDDYAQMLPVSDALQDLTPELGVPLLAVAQLNRSGADEPTMETIKACGRIEEESCLVMALHWERGGTPTSPRAKLLVLKNRGGRGQAIGKDAIRLVGSPSMAWTEEGPETVTWANDGDSYRDDVFEGVVR